MRNSNQDLAYGSFLAVAAYTCWGFFPIFWKLFESVPAYEVLFHRIIWSFCFYYILNFIIKKRISLFSFIDKKNLLVIFAGALLLLANWYLYIYAVKSGRIVESSLGYFINPLVNVLLGVLILKEHLNKIHLISVLIAAIGVGIIAFSELKIPWIAIVLAVTFSLYGLIKKKTKADTIDSNQIESFIFLVPSLIFLILYGNNIKFYSENTGLFGLLMLSGIVTGLPLLFFAGAAKRIPYYLMGFFQFIAPTLQFLSGVYLYGETVSAVKLYGFVLIWISCLMLVYGYFHKRSEKINI